MSWDQLAEIVAEASAGMGAERRTPPAACPNDGTPLEGASHGRLHCPFDGWTWPTDPNPLHDQS